MPQPSPEAPKGLTAPDFREGLNLVDKEIVRILGRRERQARILMEKRHGIISPGLGYKSYHGEDPEIPGDKQESLGQEDPKGEGHINRVAERNVVIMKTFFEAKGDPKSEDEAREREEMLVFAHYIGQIHDLVQNYKLVGVTTEDGKEVSKDIGEEDWKQHIGQGKKVVRKRIIEQNENDTIDDELKFMDDANKERKKVGKSDLFTDKHKSWVRQALLATIPGWNGATVFQPRLKWDDNGNNELTFATAWADLKGGIFMDGWQQFFKEGDLNLLEDNPDILEVALNPDQYPQALIEEVGERIRVWRANQDPFAKAQWDQLEEQIILFPEAENLFREKHFRQDTYEETYQKVQERAENDKITPALQLLIPLRERVLEERVKYPQAA